ncbi:ChbG/HpnK family deacetylase [Niallia alba]|uniref:ChbG/HpnK family deacetylase n=1 Tax=Niallia alba TaxID=2729105 RepID=UPI002E1BCBDD|nr:ChbG/HpnK family deacetylase [Niallia alba]
MRTKGSSRTVLDDLEREWTAQIEKCLDADLTPSHLDSHHHVHGIKEFYPVIKKLSDKYKLPVRNAGAHFTDIQTLTDGFLEDFEPSHSFPSKRKGSSRTGLLPNRTTDYAFFE